MNLRTTFFLLLAATILSSTSSAQVASETRSKPPSTFTASEAVKGWDIPGGSNSQNYMIGLDAENFYGGAASASIKSKFSVGEGKSAFLMQTFKADNYRGKRLRMSAFVKTENADQSFLWLRIEGEGMMVLGLDTMHDRLIRGTTGWGRYQIVLDVPNEARQIIFGLSLKGKGQVWADEFQFEEVGTQVPATAYKIPREFAESSAKRIEQYKADHKAEFEKQLQAFSQRDQTAPLAPLNLDFENQR